MRIVLFFCLLVGAKSLSATAGPLSDAARNGDVEMIAELLDDGVDVNETGLATPLQMAAMFSHTEAMKLLIERGADVEAQTPIGSALHIAAKTGNTEILTLLLDAGAELNRPDRDNYTPLMTAVREGHLAAVRVLLSRGSDPRVIAAVKGTRNGGRGRTIPLHLAINFGHADVAEELILAGASPIAPSSYSSAVSVADPINGRRSALKWCGGCHVIESEETEGANLGRYAGPTLVGIFGRPSAAVSEFENYTDALRGMEWEWNEDRLYAYANDPMLTVPGTLMRYRDDWSEQDVADIVAYLKSVAE